jgi:hypothetical protein
MSWFNWFDDTTVYSAGISITHLIPKLPESPLKASVLSAIRNDGSIVNNLIAAREQTMFSKAEDFLDYTKASYYRGLPNQNFPAQLGDVLPIIAVRENGGNVLNTLSATNLATTKKALLKVGLNLENITNGINTAPGSVDDVYTLFAANVWSDTIGSHEYFFKFLALLYTVAQDRNIIGPSTSTERRYAITFGGELRFDIITYAVNKVTLAGTIGPIDTYTRTIGTFTGAGVTTPTTFIFSRQVSANTYEQYSVIGLEVRNTLLTPGRSTMVYHTMTGSSGALALNPAFWVTTPVNGSRATFVIPLFKSVLDAMNPFIQEKFLADSLILYVHSQSSQTIAWYQSPGFIETVGAIISIATAVFSGSSISLSKDLSTLIQQVAISLVTGIVSEYIFEILAPILGEATTAAIIGMAYIVAQEYVGEGNKSLGDLPWAEDLLKAALVVVQSIDSTNTEDALKLASDIAEFTKSSSVFGKELERASGLLGSTDSNLKNSNIAAILSFYETPDEFYNRTIHQGNIGVISIDAVSSYTANKLRLPKTLSA